MAKNSINEDVGSLNYGDGGFEFNISDVIVDGMTDGNIDFSDNFAFPIPSSKNKNTDNIKSDNAHKIDIRNNNKNNLFEATPFYDDLEPIPIPGSNANNSKRKSLDSLQKNNPDSVPTNTIMKSSFDPVPMKNLGGFNSISMDDSSFDKPLPPQLDAPNQNNQSNTSRFGVSMGISNDKNVNSEGPGSGKRLIPVRLLNKNEITGSQKTIELNTSDELFLNIPLPGSFNKHQNSFNSEINPQDNSLTSTSDYPRLDQIPKGIIQNVPSPTPGSIYPDQLAHIHHHVTGSYLQGQFYNGQMQQAQNRGSMMYIPQYNTPQFPMEIGFATSLDRSISNFKRMFTNEFNQIFRQQSNNVTFDVDEFSDKLASEIASIIECPVTPADINSQNIARKVQVAIDEHTKPVTGILIEAEQRNSVAAEHHISELKQLQEELDSLRTVYRTSAEQIYRELERERQNSAAIRDNELSHSREIEQKLRTLKLRQIELETRAKNQAVEEESLERSLKMFEQKRREWEDERLPNLYDEGGAIRRRIIDELSALRAEISQESFDELSQTINEGLRIIKEEGDSLRNELMDLELANRWMMSHSRESHIRHISSPKKGAKKSSIAAQSRERLNKIRRKNAESTKDFTEQIR